MLQFNLDVQLFQVFHIHISFKKKKNEKNEIL